MSDTGGRNGRRASRLFTAAVIYGSGVERAPVTEQGSGIRVEVWVVPGSSHPGLAGLHGGMLKVRVSSPPEGGRANREVAELLGRLLGSRAELVRGITGRHKVFEIAGVDAGTALRKLGLSP